MMLQLRPVLLFILALVIHAEEFKDNDLTCLNQELADKSYERTKAPFSITLNSESYRAGDSITVTIVSTTRLRINGFLVKAQQIFGGSMEAIGHFIATDGLRLVCSTSGNAVTHKDGPSLLPTDKLVLQWKAPLTSQGHLQFLASIIAEDGRYWAGEKLAILKDVFAPPLTTKKPEEPLFQNRIELKGCGQNKGCYRNPAGCSIDECDMVLTWQNFPDYVNFELSGDSEGWVAFGLSTDKKMGEDDVVDCYFNSTANAVFARVSYNTRKGKINKVMDYPQSGLRNVVADKVGRRILCSFTKLKYPEQKTLFNMEDSYYLLMAKGKVKPDGTKARHELEPFKYPYISKKRVSLKDEVDINGTTRYALVKLHACLMLLAWMLCTPVALLMAKYYKLMWPNDRICNERVWFAVHRGCQLVTLIATVLGFILIFVHANGYSQMPDLPDRAHPILGIIVTVLVILNPLIALCRCNPKSSKRPIFNWIHWFFGTIAMVLASVALFLGINLPKSFIPWWGTWVIAVFFLFHLIIELMLEIHGCINGRKQKRRSEEYEMTRRNYNSYQTKGDYQGLEPEPVGTHFKKRILFVYLVVAIILFLITIIAVAVG